MLIHRTSTPGHASSAPLPYMASLMPICAGLVGKILKLISLRDSRRGHSVHGTSQILPRSTPDRPQIYNKSIEHLSKIYRKSIENRLNIYRKSIEIHEQVFSLKPIVFIRIRAHLCYIKPEGRKPSALYQNPRSTHFQAFLDII